MDQSDIRSKLTVLQEAIRDYRAAVGEGAWFLTDGAAPVLSSDKLRACRLCANRAAFYQQLDRPKAVVETGTRDGAAALQIMQQLNPLSLVCIDANFAALDMDSLAPFMDRIRLRPGKPWVQLDTYEDNSFDLLVLAGVPENEALTRCLASGLRIVRCGGLILCAGFTNWSAGAMQPYGVYNAVCQFLDQQDVELAHLILQPLAFHDAVIRVVGK